MKAEKVLEKIVPDDGDRLMTREETAARLQTSLAGLRKIIAAKELIPIRKGDQFFFRKHALNDFLARWEGRDLMELIG